MRVVFDFGTDRNIPIDVINNVFASAINMASSVDGGVAGMTMGRCVVYLNFYNEDGLESFITNEDHEKLCFVVMNREYNRLPKDTKLNSIRKDAEGNDVFIYERYESTLK